MSYPYGRGTLPESRAERLGLLRAYDRAYHEFVRRGETTMSWEVWMGFNLYGGVVLFGRGRRGKWWVE